MKKNEINAVLDKINAEIDEKINHYKHFSSSNTANGLMMAKNIIDSYRADSDYKRGREEGWRLAAMIIDIWFNKIHCDANRFNNYFKLNGKLNDDVFKLFFEQYTAEEAAEVLKKEGVI